MVNRVLSTRKGIAMKRFLQIAAALLICQASLSRADVITVSAVADTTVDALQPDVEFGADDLKAAKVGEVDQTAEQLTFFYAQFQLPDGLTGQNIASVNSVNLQLRRAAGSPALSLTYYVYGVFDGIDTESATTYTWNDGVGFDPSHTLVKFLNPGNEEIFNYSDAAESAFVGSLDTASEGPPQRPFGFVQDAFQAAFALENRSNLILDDTDGRITFLVNVRANFAVTPLQMFASVEDGVILPPQLIIDYTPGSAAVSGDYNDDGMVDGADLTVWEGAFGQTGTGQAADGDEDGDVDGADFLIWQQNVGASGTLAAVAAVPEPAAGPLGLIVLASITRLRRSRQRA
jgi:hypothetical protein